MLRRVLSAVAAAEWWSQGRPQKWGRLPRHPPLAADDTPSSLPLGVYAKGFDFAN
jgi:hypothetical protein